MDIRGIQDNFFIIYGKLIQFLFIYFIFCWENKKIRSILHYWKENELFRVYYRENVFLFRLSVTELYLLSYMQYWVVRHAIRKITIVPSDY